jgi:hypothetical protein
MESYCGRGQGSLWTVAPTEEEEEKKEQNITTFYLFIDLKSAFDSVIREQLYATVL